MKRILVTTALAGLVAARLGAGGVSIKGAYVEARTAEVFTGGCIMNGEAATTGREALLAWKVDRGSFEGVSLNGLAVVAAVAGDANLGIREIGGETARTRVGDLRRRARDCRAARGARVDGQAALERHHRDGRRDHADVDSVRRRRAGDPGRGEIAPADRRQRDEARSDLRRQAVVPSAVHGRRSRRWARPPRTPSAATALGTKWSDPNKRSSFFGTFSY